MPRAGRGGCLQYGLLGCGGLIALCFVVGATLLMVGRSVARSQKMTTKTVEEPLGGFAAEAQPAGSQKDEATRPFSDGPPLEAPALPGPGDGKTPPRGRMTIDLSHGEFEVVPAPVGQPLRVEADYDPDWYRLETRMEHSQGAWSYVVRFERTQTLGFIATLAQAMGGKRPHVWVQLPRDVPMDLDLRFSQGGGEVDLGGLWLTKTQVAFRQGGGDLEFSEPLREPTDTLSIDASMGGGSFRRLGDASPRRLLVQTRMGGGDLDLRGHWLRDCQVSLESQMGGLKVRLPEGVATRGLPHDRAGEGEGGEIPTLTFSYSAAMGGVDFVN